MPEAGPAAACSCDVVIFGGGINGAGIARDLAEHPDTAFARFEQAVAQRHRPLPAALRRRLARQCGARIEMVLGRPTLGSEVAPGLFEAALGYLHHHEWARNADDVLWRRTKLGLHLGDAQRAGVATWCRSHWADHVAATPSSWG